MLASLVLVLGLPVPSHPSLHEPSPDVLVLDAPCLVAVPGLHDEESALLVHLEGHRSRHTHKNVWSQVDYLFLRGMGTQLNLHQPEPREEGSHQVGLPLPVPGVWMAGFDRTSRAGEASLPDWRDFLSTRLPTATSEALLALTPSRGPVRLRLRSSGLCLIGTTDDPGADPASTATSKAGLRAELRLLADPLSWNRPSDLPVRAYVEGDKLAGARVFARHQDQDTAQSVLANESGIANLRLHRGGHWRLWFFEVRSAGPEAADAPAGMVANPADFLVYRFTYTLQLPEWQ